MTDLPVFTAADGLATLILHEIPAKREAYILVRTVFGTLDGLLRECAAFCRGAGAEHVYAGGAADFSGYPVFVRLIERSAEFPAPAQTDCAVEPVTQDTAERWAALYNDRFRAVPSAQSCGFAETRSFSRFIRRGNQVSPLEMRKQGGSSRRPDPVCGQTADPARVK